MHHVHQQRTLFMLARRNGYSAAGFSKLSRLCSLHSRRHASASTPPPGAAPTPKSKRLTPFFKRAVEHSKTVFYFAVIIGGFTLTGAVLWSLFEELFSRNGIHSLYQGLCQKIQADTQISASLGSPVKAYTDLQSARRRGPKTVIVKDSEQTKLKMQFHLIGSLHHAVVDAEFLQDPATGQWKEHLVVIASPTGFTKYLVRPPPPPSLGSFLHGAHPLARLFGRFFGRAASSEKDLHK